MRFVLPPLPGQMGWGCPCHICSLPGKYTLVSVTLLWIMESQFRRPTLISFYIIKCIVFICIIQLCNKLHNQKASEQNVSYIGVHIFSNIFYQSNRYIIHQETSHENISVPAFAIPDRTVFNAFNPEP